jgi:hypothetical protein
MALVPNGCDNGSSCLHRRAAFGVHHFASLHFGLGTRYKTHKTKHLEMHLLFTHFRGQKIAIDNLDWYDRILILKSQMVQNATEN